MTDLSNLDPLPFALLRKVADSPGVRRKGLRKNLGVSKYKFNQVVDQMKGEGLIKHQDSHGGQAHEFQLGSAVTHKEVEAEVQRREKLGIDLKARAALSVIHRKLKELVSELDELLNK